MFISCSFDNRSKKLYLYMLGFVLSFTCILIMRKTDFLKEVFDIFLYVNSLGRILVIIPYFASKYVLKSITNEAWTKNSKNDYIIFILNIFIDFIFILFSKAISGFYFSSESLLLLFILLLTMPSNKYEIYKHKTIGLISFVILAFLIDIFTYIFGIREKLPQFKYIVVVLIYTLLYSITLYYRKYLMDKKYISPFIVCLFYGILDLIAQIILEIIGYKYKDFIYLNGRKINIIGFSNYDALKNTPILLLKSIPYIICYVILYCFYYLLIANFSLIHGVIMEIITLFADVLLTFCNNEAAYVYAVMFIIYAFIVISLFIYIETIQLRFCGLSADTRSELLEREKIDFNKISENIDKDKERVSIDDEYDVDFLPITNETNEGS